MKNKRLVKVLNFQPGEEYITLDIKDLRFLKENFTNIFEGPEGFFAVREKIVYRVKKPFKPKLLKASALSYEPTSTVIHTSFRDLCKIAERYDVEIFELPDSFVICYPGLLWLAKKEKEA